MQFRAVAIALSPLIYPALRYRIFRRYFDQYADMVLAQVPLHYPVFTLPRQLVKYFPKIFCHFSIQDFLPAFWYPYDVVGIINQQFVNRFPRDDLGKYPAHCQAREYRASHPLHRVLG